MVENYWTIRTLQKKKNKFLIKYKFLFVFSSVNIN